MTVLWMDKIGREILDFEVKVGRGWEKEGLLLMVGRLTVPFFNSVIVMLRGLSCAREMTEGVVVVGDLCCVSHGISSWE